MKNKHTAEPRKRTSIEGITSVIRGNLPAVVKSYTLDNEPEEIPFFMRHRLILPLILFLMLFFVGLILFVSLSGQTVGAADKHVVELFYDGKDQTVPTRAKTVGDLLARLDITLGKKDVVEPTLEMPIVEDNFKINIYRARTVEVIDGTSKTIMQSATKSPNVLAREAGLSLLQDDVAHFESPDDTLKGPVVAEKLVVERSVPLNVSLYGVLGTYRTRAKTVSGFLDEKHIELKDAETTQPADLNSPVTAGMLLSINLPGKQVVSTEEPISFAVTKHNNPALAAGQEKVAQKGVDGKRAVLYEVEVKDGKEVSRRALQTIVLLNPVDEIRERGTMAAATYSVSSDKAALMAAAGIDPSQFAAVDYIVSKESHWTPGVVNAHGCIGLGQRCPSGGGNALVSACPAWQTDPVCQLQHFTGYAVGRYGSWQGAYRAWLAQGWW